MGSTQDVLVRVIALNKGMNVFTQATQELVDGRSDSPHGSCIVLDEVALSDRA
jgi:hypothetical protein